MAAIAAVIVAVFLSAWRSLRKTSSFTGNNLVAFIALLMAAEPRNRPSVTAVFYLIIGMLLILPLSQELTRRIPSIRLRVWPLNSSQKVIIFGINLLSNPLIAIAILFGLLSGDRQVGLGLLLIGAVAPAAVFAGNALAEHLAAWSPFRLITRPPGRLGGLVQSQIRTLLQMLDVYFALMTAIGGVIYTRFAAKPDPAASIVLGCLVVLLMSTSAQGYATFDAQASQTRMRLLPASGVALLLAKDTAWMLLTIPLIIWFRPLTALASALAVLLIGHSTSAKQPIEQRRWSFATGRLVPQGLLQLISLAGAASAVQQWGWLAFAAVAASYGASLWWWGHQWDRGHERQ